MFFTGSRYLFSGFLLEKHVYSPGKEAYSMREYIYTLKDDRYSLGADFHSLGEDTFSLRKGVSFAGIRSLFDERSFFDGKGRSLAGDAYALGADVCKLGAWRRCLYAGQSV